MFVIQIAEFNGSEHDGRYVCGYDPDAHQGLGQVWSTPFPQNAIKFASVVDAAQFLRQTSKVKPIRDDGKPNKPLTAFTVSIFDWTK